MRKLIDKYKNMPPEMRMLLAAAGLGSFGTIVWTINGWLFQGRRIFGLPSIAITSLAIAALMGLLYGAGSLVSKGFNLRSKKRGEKMMEEMGGDLGRGPVSMDAREAVKENNRKFFDEISEMRKQTKLSVYDLPWYIVIGDSGCGKTRLIEHSGLTFSRGRPEGYQLGTLNYNWWFTEDAIFVDMAGRLCNPQEDADHKEWQGFLNTVAKGRPACPINGAIVCISAEHLLEDAPEKIEGDANTMLERLRDLQGKLGVTFATYVVVTKCDKILGFMQFFDRAERDVEVRNQMVGWTRPAPFTDLFDPDGFQSEFEGLYQRLNELRVRRLSDEAEEEELGMAYCLPEEFRELRDPLQTYLRVLFPPIKNPRAIKNLVARGVYFTSSVQQGSVILKHLKERMGPEAGENIKPLEDLYGKAKQKPLFIKHLLIRKVFPEYGLVFRNANEVARNKRYSRLLYIWSGVLAAVLFGLMAWGISGFGNLIGAPRAHAKSATESPDKRQGDIKDSTALATALAGDIDHVTKGSGFRTWMAAPLVWNKSGPVNNLRIVRAGLYQRDVLPQIFRNAADAFEKKKPAAPRAYEPTSQPAQDADFVAYKDSLLAYCRWIGWARQSADGQFYPATDAGNLPDRKSDLMTLIAWGGAGSATTQPADVTAAAEDFINFLGNLEKQADVDKWPHPATTAIASGALSDATAGAAVRVVGDYFRTNYATLSDTHPDLVVREWISRNKACLHFLEQYNNFLKLADRKDVNSAEAFDELRKKQFTDKEATLELLKADFEKATQRWPIGRESGGRTRISSFDQAIERVRKNTWVAFAKDVSVAAGGDKASGEIKAAIATVHTGSGDVASNGGVDKDLWEQLAKADMLEDADQPYGPESYKDFTKNVADHVSPRASAVITVSVQPEESDSLQATASAQAVWAHLNQIKQAVSAISLGSDKATAVAPTQWSARMIALESTPEPPAWTDKIDNEKTWRPEALREVEKRVADWSRRAETTNLFSKMAEKLASAAKEDWGIESLLSSKAAAEGDAAASDTPAATEGGATRRKPLQFGKHDDSGAPSGDRRAQAVWPAISSRVLGESIQDTVRFTADVQCNVQRLERYQFKPASGKSASDLCLEQLAAALTQYFTKYVGYWSDVYPQSKLEKVQTLLGARSLDELQTLLRNDGGAVGIELRQKLGDVLEHVCWSNQIRPLKSGDRDFDEVVSAAVRDMMRQLDGLWESQWRDTNHKRFIRLATQGADVSEGKTPAAITKSLLTGWDSLSSNILKAELGPSAQARELAKDFVNARESNGLGDERLTESIIELASRAASLINAQLKDDLCGAQRTHLGNFTAGEGWPYTNGGGVVDGPAFFKFLESVAAIESKIGAKAASSDPVYAKFFSECKEWRDFLGLQGSRPTALDLFIVYEPPPESYEGIQNYYNRARLKLGFTGQGGCDPENMPIREQQFRSTGCQAQWTWQDLPDAGVLTLEEKVDPQEKIPDAHRTNIGFRKALDICSFLQKYATGTKTGAEMRVLIPIDLQLPGKPKVCQFRIRFTGRSLPRPISKLPC